MDWLHLALQVHGPSAGLVIGFGLVVGWASTLSGLGAGLALPLLAAVGLPLPAALLSVKLPVTAADLAATLGACRQGDLAFARALMSPVCLVAAAAGAGAAGIALMVPAAWVVAAAVSSAGLAWRLRRAAASANTHPAWLAVAWGGYVGVCGMGAGLLWRWSGRAGHADLKVDLSRGGLAWRAAANVGAVLVLVSAGHHATAPLCMLAGAQGLGAFLAMRHPPRLGRLLRRRPAATQ